MRQAELGVLEERLATHADGELVDEDVIRSLHGFVHELPNPRSGRERDASRWGAIR
jgi:hypothetical protein